MPKERIKDEYGSAIAQVTWSQDADVQLATLSTSPESFVAWCRDIVEQADSVKSGTDERGLPHLTDPRRLTNEDSLGIFWTPNRPQINQLIRVLRRARNAAYGIDE